ncbi:MAG: hypothetical protein Q9191_000405 [Dirinaria sp. TL-2023a]
MADTLFAEDELLELRLLREEEIDALVAANLLGGEQRWDSELLDGFTFNYPEMKLIIETGARYPAEPLFYRVENASLPRLVIDALRVALRQIALTDSGTNTLDAWKDRASNAYGRFEFAMTSLHLASKTAEYLKSFRLNLASLQGLSAAHAQSETLSDRKHEISLKAFTGDVTVNSILGSTPEEICADLPTEFRVLHVENVLRNDLVRRFYDRQDVVRQQLHEFSVQDLKTCMLPAIKTKMHGKSQRKEDLITYLVTPQVTFHGTRRDFVPSIVRQGFLMPGANDFLTGKTHGTRCGSTYGRGIYSSPSAAFSLSYAGSARDGGIRATKPNEYDGLKLIVCATVMGATAHLKRCDNWRGKGYAAGKANSHRAFNDQEYTVFHEAQILPCYVIHLDWGDDNSKFFEDIPADPDLWAEYRKRLYAWRKLHKNDWEKIAGPGEVQRGKEDRMQRARKYLGYGFGPKEGNQLVVEEIAEVDDDEEDYGQYQEDRNGKADSKSSFWALDLADDYLWEDGRFNEYAQEKRIKDQ